MTHYTMDYSNMIHRIRAEILAITASIDAALENMARLGKPPLDPAELNHVDIVR